MNIFFLSMCIRRCAKYHFDKHVVKMILEMCQLLSTAWHVLDPIIVEEKKLLTCGSIYRKTHVNHPCSKWVREHINNYMYVVKLGLELCKEWRFRYGHPSTKLHACEPKLEFLKNPPPSIPRYSIEKTKFNPMRFTLPMPQAMPDECKYKPDKPSVKYCIIAYRRYYMSSHKEKLRSWTKVCDTLPNKNEKKRIDLPPIYWWKVRCDK